MRGIVAGGILMTAPFWSLAVTMIGVWRSFALLEKERAPDPEELQEIAQLSPSSGRSWPWARSWSG